MADTPLEVVGIGNAVVDVLTHADDAFLEERGLVKGAMTLVDAEQAGALYAGMAPALEVSGGSVANTVTGLASLGGHGAFIGKVCDDQLGGIFSHDIKAAGVEYNTPPAIGGAPTARCLIFITPDAQRTMQTFLGASVDLGPRDIDEALVTRARVTYLEGYLWDPTKAKKALNKAARIARGAGNKVALSLSDALLVERHRESFCELIKDYVNILFANEVEIAALVRAEGFDEALQRARGLCDVAALTRSEKGSLILAGDEVHVIDAEKVTQVVDTTGAGDLFAAGFLHGFTRGLDLGMCGRIGGIAAAEIISHFGARPESPLADLVWEKLA